MTRDAVIALARECGAYFATPYDGVGLERFAAAIEARVREECADNLKATELRANANAAMFKSLHAENEALRQDAERYRYAVSIGGNLSMNWLDVYDDWDGEFSFTDAIDAAMQTQAPTGA